MATTRALSQEDGNLNSVPLVSSRLSSYSDIDLLFTGPAAASRLLRESQGLPATGEVADIYKKIDAGAVRQSVKTILLTNHFEKPFLPLFGADLNGMLFELNDLALAPVIERQIIETISIYEPRAKVIEIKIVPGIDENEMSVSVVFQIVSTKEQQTLTTKVARLR